MTSEKSLRQPVEVGDVNVSSYRSKLTVYTRNSNGSVTIGIKGNGPGIQDNMKGKILQPFFTTKKTQGTWLGLSITKNIIKSHGGQITIQSDSESSTFIITLSV